MLAEITNACRFDGRDNEIDTFNGAHLLQQSIVEQQSDEQKEEHELHARS